MASGSGIKLSLGHLQAMQQKAKSLQGKADSIKKKADTVIGALVDTGIVSAAAFGAGVVQGRTGGVMLPGNVSLELGLGVLANGLGFFGIGGRHLHSAGNGLLAVHFATMGRGQGRAMLEKKNKELAAAGKPPEGGGVHLLGSKPTGEKEIGGGVHGERSRTRANHIPAK